MERKTLKHMIYFTCVAYLLIRCYDFLSYSYKFDEKTDFFFLVGICAAYIFYYWSKTFFKFSLKDVKKLNEYHILKYKLLTSSDDKRMYKIYIKSPFEYIWMELDYALTISQYCDLNNAIYFVNTYTNGEKLKKVMESKSQNEMNIENSHYDDVIVRNISLLMLGFLVIFSFVGYYITFIYN